MMDRSFSSAAVSTDSLVQLRVGCLNTETPRGRALLLDVTAPLSIEKRIRTFISATYQPVSPYSQLETDTIRFSLGRYRDLENISIAAAAVSHLVPAV